MKFKISRNFNSKTPFRDWNFHPLGLLDFDETASKIDVEVKSKLPAICHSNSLTNDSHIAYTVIETLEWYKTLTTFISKLCRTESDRNKDQQPKEGLFV